MMGCQRRSFVSRWRYFNLSIKEEKSKPDKETERNILIIFDWNYTLKKGSIFCNWLLHGLFHAPAAWIYNHFKNGKMAWPGPCSIILNISKQNNKLNTTIQIFGIERCVDFFKYLFNISILILFLYLGLMGEKNIRKNHQIPSWLISTSFFIIIK